MFSFQMDLWSFKTKCKSLFSRMHGNVMLTRACTRRTSIRTFKCHSAYPAPPCSIWAWNAALFARLGDRLMFRIMAGVTLVASPLAGVVREFIPGMGWRAELGMGFENRFQNSKSDATGVINSFYWYWQVVMTSNSMSVIKLRSHPWLTDQDGGTWHKCCFFSSVFGYYYLTISCVFTRFTHVNLRYTLDTTWYQSSLHKHRSGSSFQLQPATYGPWKDTETKYNHSSQPEVSRTAAIRTHGGKCWGLRAKHRTEKALGL